MTHTEIAIALARAGYRVRYFSPNTPNPLQAVYVECTRLADRPHRIVHVCPMSGAIAWIERPQ